MAVRDTQMLRDQKNLRTTGLLHNQMCHTQKLKFCRNEIDKYML